MHLLLYRKYKKAEYTIGQLSIDGELFCNTLEDTDRDLASSMSDLQIKSKKIPTRTAIPTGTYEITLDVVSPKYSKYDFYKKVCDGKLPRLLDVKGFDGILIHCGTNASNSSGCILIGFNKIKGGLVDSKPTFEKLYKKLLDAKSKGEKITIEIY